MNYTVYNREGEKTNNLFNTNYEEHWNTFVEKYVLQTVSECTFCLFLGCFLL